MKRRKKLWIAGAALAVVVMLCALALLFRPKPYDFLNGARLVGVSSDRAYVSLGTTTALALPMKERTTYRYTLERDFESVTVAAGRELTKQDDWVWSAPDGLMVATAWNRTGDDSVAIYESGGEERKRVHVTVTVPTSTLDRVLTWLHNR